MHADVCTYANNSGKHVVVSAWWWFCVMQALCEDGCGDNDTGEVEFYKMVVNKFKEWWLSV